MTTYQRVKVFLITSSTVLARAAEWGGEGRHLLATATCCIPPHRDVLSVLTKFTKFPTAGCSAACPDIPISVEIWQQRPTPYIQT